MLRQLKFAYSSGPFNLVAPFKQFRAMLQAPLKHIKATISPDGSYKPISPNITTDAFDEVAHEWQALYTNNPYHLQIYNNLDNIQTVNFGTVDNPAVVFTADAPFRYVGCTGLQNEDDYEQHELMMFMLREGPLQRCPICGQVFKLVRLRHKQDEEMNYWQTSFHPIDPREFDLENIQMMNIFKIDTHYEGSLFEAQQSDNAISLVNPDEHDRILVDPAYRLWKQNYAQQKFNVVADVFNKIDQQFLQNTVRIKTPVSKVIYESSIEADKAWAILDRHRKKVQRFNVREYLDVENHERREKRMQQKIKERWDNHYTLFYGGLTEEEARYNDYFQTDNEIENEDEQIEQKLDEVQILQRPDYNPKNYDFQEAYTHNPEDDQSSLLEKKLFRFRYRAAEDGIAEYTARQKRMVERQVNRMVSNEDYKRVFAELQQAYDSKNDVAKLKAENSYLSIAAQEGFLMYKDYYEGDKEAEIELVEALFKSKPTTFVTIFKNYAASITEQKGYTKIARRPWDESLGLFSNWILDWASLQETIVPTAERLTNQATYSEVLPESEENLLAFGLLQAKQEAKAQIEAQKKRE